MFTQTAVLVVLAFCVAYVNAHASCKLQWKFTDSCEFVFGEFVAAANTMGPDAPCNGSQRCMYSIKTQDENTKLRLVHTTPKKKYTDSMTISFTTSGNGCIVNGYSTSDLWYAILDYGTNYCNLRNLADAAVPYDGAFSEKVSDHTCTQYSSHDCDKY